MIQALTLLFAAALTVPALCLLMLVLASLRGRKTAPPVRAPSDRRPRVVVLVPAHNESVGLIPTVTNIKAQLLEGDRIVVIADNCSDDTAQVASAAGAQVLERSDITRRGKGFALAHGVDSLRRTPPAVVMVVDADCILSVDAVDVAVRACAATQRPVQMLNLMESPSDASIRHRLLEFAMRVKNQVRSLGTSNLGGACHLMGTGMALPWSLISTAELATGHIAEDMKLGTDLAVTGHTTLFLPQASVRSKFPDREADSHVQKSRWEHGHLATMREQLPRLLTASLRLRNKGLLVLAMDLCIPPLAMYVLMLMAAVSLVTVAALAWPVLWPAAAWLGIGSLSVIAAILLSWKFFARQLLSPQDLLSALAYVVWKAPIYLSYFANRRSGWVRANRSGRS